MVSSTSIHRTHGGSDVLRWGISDRRELGNFRLALTGRTVTRTNPVAFLVVGVFRRWRWTFWLVLIAFFFGVLRLPASALQLAGIMPASGPTWYEVMQGVIGVVQFLIAIAMFAGYRKVGVWGDF